MSLHSLLKQAGLKQQDLAERIGLKTAAIGHYCTGRRMIKYKHATGIREVLAERGVECDIEQLLKPQAERPRGNVCVSLIASAASRMVKAAIEAGHLPSLRDGETKCTDCDKPADRYDHRNYAEPLSVDPVCCGCNALRGPAVFEIRKAA